MALASLRKSQSPSNGPGGLNHLGTVALLTPGPAVLSLTQLQPHASLLFLQLAWLFLLPGVFFLQICMANSLSSLVVSNVTFSLSPSLITLCKMRTVWCSSPSPPDLPALLCSSLRIDHLLAFNTLYLFILFFFLFFFCVYFVQ